MRAAVVLVMILGGATLTKADIIETVSLDLSELNSGSTLFGSFALSASPADGDMAPVTLSFSDPSDYSPTSLTTTISLTTFGEEFFAVYFEPVDFTAVSTSGPEEIDLTSFSTFSSPAVCSGFPCNSHGTFLIVSNNLVNVTIHDYAAFTVTPTPVPEPRYALLVPLLFLAIIFGRSLLVRNQRRAPESDGKTTCPS